MKKTLTINLSGVVFHIDEDAYQTLQNYLNEIGSHFTSDEEKEIMRDIEARIAELFNEKLKGNKDVVEINDVNHVIAVMGNPNDFDDSDAEPRSAQYNEKEAKSSQKTTFKSKRFYRDPDNMVLGGVAGGLAAYLDWDVTLVRVIFFVLTLVTQGWFLVAYILLWIIAPEARSAAQKLEMRGVDATIENIKNYMASDQFKEAAAKAGNGFTKAIRIIMKILLVMIGSFVGFICIIVILALFASMIAVIVGLPGLISSDQLMFDYIPSPMMVVLVISLIVLLACPVIGIIIGLVRLLNPDRDTPKRWVGWTLLFAWFVSLLVCVFIGVYTLKDGKWRDIQHYIQMSDADSGNRITEVRSVTPFNAIEINDAIDVTLVQADTTLVEVSASDADIRKVNVFVENGVLKLETASGTNKRRYVHVLVKTPNINAITASDASRVTANDTIRGNALNLSVNEASKATLLLAVDNLSVKASEASTVVLSGQPIANSIEASEASKVTSNDTIRGNSLKIKASEASHVDLVVSVNYLDVRASEASKATISGRANNINRNATEMSKIEFDLNK